MTRPMRKLIRRLLGAAILWGTMSAEAQSAAPTSETAQSPETNDVVRLWTRGRSQYLAGEPALAEQTLRQLLAIDPFHVQARQLLAQITNSVADDRRRK